MVQFLCVQFQGILGWSSFRFWCLRRSIYGTCSRRIMLKEQNELKRENASQILGLTGPKLEEALERQYSLLYRYVGPKSKIPFWHEALLKVGLNLSQGGRVFAVSGNHDKATPIQWLSEKLCLVGKRLPKIIAIGDSNNDKPMLLRSAVACVIPHLNGSCVDLPDHPCVVFAEAPAPFGWRYAAKKALEML